jgi:lipoate-protein ligase A
MTIAGRILTHRTATGPANMALDEALLEDVAADPTVAYVRTYEWSVPTLSLGYFQGLAAARAEPRFRSVPIVRRSTGGGALWHDRDITYAVIIPATHPFARQTQVFYEVIHRAIGQVIKTRGLAVVRRGDSSPGPASRTERHGSVRSARPLLCFTDEDAEDLVSNGVKVVGSAQRRRAGAVLQHGSILLTGSEITPELPGVTDLMEETRAKNPGVWSAPIIEAIAHALDLEMRDFDVPDIVTRRAFELENSIYANPIWTGRR